MQIGEKRKRRKRESFSYSGRVFSTKSAIMGGGPKFGQYLKNTKARIKIIPALSEMGKLVDALLQCYAARHRSSSLFSHKIS
jgi:hypothetical protein